MADQLANPSDLVSLMPELTLATAELRVECATAVIQAITRQRIIQIAETITLDLDEYNGGPYLVLPERPIISVTAVSIGATAVTDYSVQTSRYRLWRPDGWRSTLLNYHDQPSTVTVTYAHGYPAGHQRLQLARHAVISLSASVPARLAGPTRVTIDDYTETYEAMSAQMNASDGMISLLYKQYGRPVGSTRLVNMG